MPNDLPAPGPALPRAAAETGEAGPAGLYRERVQAGLIHADPAQQRVVGRLQRLYEELGHYRPQGGRRGWLSWLGLGERGEPQPHGIYLWGPVGRGKSMLMDLFFAAAPLEKK